MSHTPKADFARLTQLNDLLDQAVSHPLTKGQAQCVKNILSAQGKTSMPDAITDKLAAALRTEMLQGTSTLLQDDLFKLLFPKTQLEHTEIMVSGQPVIAISPKAIGLSNSGKLNFFALNEPLYLGIFRAMILSGALGLSNVIELINSNKDDVTCYFTRPHGSQIRMDTHHHLLRDLKLIHEFATMLGNTTPFLNGTQGMPRTDDTVPSLLPQQVTVDNLCAAYSVGMAPVYASSAFWAGHEDRYIALLEQCPPHVTARYNALSSHWLSAHYAQQASPDATPLQPWTRRISQSAASIDLPNH